MENSRLKVRVGLGARLYDDGGALTPKSIGTPSRIPPSFFIDGEVVLTESRFGNGKLESGPARLCRTSKLDLFLKCDDIELVDPCDV